MIPRSRALDDDDVFLKVAGYKLRARWDLPRLRELTRTLQPEESMMRDSPLSMIRRHRALGRYHPTSIFGVLPPVLCSHARAISIPSH